MMGQVTAHRRYRLTKLAGAEPAIQTIDVGHELCVCSDLDDQASVHHDDQVSVDDRR